MYSASCRDEYMLMSIEVCGTVHYTADPQPLHDSPAAYTPRKVGDDRGIADLLTFLFISAGRQKNFL